MEPCTLTLHDLMTEMKALRQDIVTHREEFHSAFPLNTIGRPDLDGHRTTHEAQITSAKNLETYKTKVVEKILLATVTGLLTIFGLGFGPYLQKILSQVKGVIS